MANQFINCVSYRRVSTPKQVLEGEGLDIQLDRIQSFCGAHGYSIVDDGDFVDEGVCGAKESIDRKGIMSMLGFCKERNSASDKTRHIKYVVIDKVDRLSRELFQQLFIEKQLLVYGVTILFSAQETLNSTSEADKAMINLMRQMMGAFAEFERVLIKQRLGDGIMKKASKGDRPVGRQAFGYIYGEDGRSSAVNEAEAVVVQTIFHKRVMGHSLQQIADHINNISTFTLRTRFSKHNQKRKWTKHSIRDILLNDFYIGVVTYKGKKTQGNHKALIDAGMWAKVHGVELKQNTNQMSDVTQAA